MGCHYLFPSARTVINIGGQFTKVAKITPQGRVVDFLMSEKCVAGSGRFLQVIARILHVTLENIGPLSLQSREPVEFSTNCAVFAESETISRIAEGARAEDILAGVHRAMAIKVAMLVKGVKMEPDVVLMGGGGEDAGLVLAIGEALALGSSYRSSLVFRPPTVPPAWQNLTSLFRKQGHLTIGRRASMQTFIVRCRNKI